MEETPIDMLINDLDYGVKTFSNNIHITLLQINNLAISSPEIHPSLVSKGIIPRLVTIMNKTHNNPKIQKYSCYILTSLIDDNQPNQPSILPNQPTPQNQPNLPDHFKNILIESGILDTISNNCKVYQNHPNVIVALGTFLEKLLFSKETCEEAGNTGIHETLMNAVIRYSNFHKMFYCFCKIICELTIHINISNPDILSCILYIMDRNQQIPFITTHGCSAILGMMNYPNNRCIMNEAGINTIIRQMSIHETDPIVLNWTTAALLNIAKYNEHNQDLINNNDGIQKITTAMANYTNNPEIQSICLKALLVIVVGNQENLETLRKNNGEYLITLAMNKYPNLM